MSEHTFDKLITEHYKIYNAHMRCYPENHVTYKLMLIARMAYCVNIELDKKKGNYTLHRRMKMLIKTIGVAVLYPFFTFRTLRKGEVMMIPVFASDCSTAEYLHIPKLEFSKRARFSFSAIRDVTQGSIGLLHIAFMRGIRFWRIIELYGQILVAYKCSKEADLSQIKLLIFSDDTSPFPTGILYKAQSEKIIRLKFEYAQINSLMHDNVFADYYFYPTTLHLKIRQSSWMNTNLQYIKGGYVNVNNIGESVEVKKAYTPEKLITYFTGHTDLYEFDDHYYINQIIKSMPSGYRLAIKVHPYEDIKNYRYLSDNKQVEIYAFNDVVNGDLINRSEFCLSQYSAMSLEAKLICVNSYFVCYTWDSSCYAPDFNYQRNFFDIIDSPEFLSKVFRAEYTPCSIETFKANVNMTYPYTFKIFKNLIDKLLNNIPLGQLEEHGL